MKQKELKINIQYLIYLNYLKRYYILLFRNSYGSEVYDEEVEAFDFETSPDEEESTKATASSSQCIERTSVIESVW